MTHSPPSKALTAVGASTAQHIQQLKKSVSLTFQPQADFPTIPLAQLKAKLVTIFSHHNCGFCSVMQIRSFTTTPLACTFISLRYAVMKNDILLVCRIGAVSDYVQRRPIEASDEEFIFFSLKCPTPTISLGQYSMSPLVTWRCCITRPFTDVCRYRTECLPVTRMAEMQLG